MYVIVVYYFIFGMCVSWRHIGESCVLSIYKENESPNYLKNAEITDM